MVIGATENIVHFDGGFCSKHSASYIICLLSL